MCALEVTAEVGFGGWLAKETDGAWLYFKWTSQYDTGWPDRWLIGPERRILFAEWKKLGKVLSALQLERKLTLERRGHIVFIWKTQEQAKREIRDYFYAEGLPNRGYKIPPSKS